MSSLNENGPSSEDDDEELAMLRAAALRSKRSTAVPSNHNSPSHVPIASDPPNTYQPVESLVNARDGLEPPKNDVAYVPSDIYVPTDTYVPPPPPAEMYTIPPPSIDMYARPPPMEIYSRPPPEMFLQRMPPEMFFQRHRFPGPLFHRGRMPRMPFGRPNFMRPPPHLMQQAPPPVAVPSAAANSNLIVIQTADGDSAQNTAASFHGPSDPSSRGGFSRPFRGTAGTVRGRGRGQGPWNSQPQQADANASSTPMFVRPQDKWTGDNAAASTSVPKTRVSTKFSRYNDDSSDSDDHESTDSDSDSDGSGQDSGRVPSTPTDSHVDLPSSPMPLDESVELNDAVDSEILDADHEDELLEASLPLPADRSRSQSPSVDDQKIAVVGGSASPVRQASPARSSSSLSSGSDLGPHSPIRSPLRLDSPVKSRVHDRSPVRSRSPSDRRLVANRSPSPTAVKSPARLPIREVENPIIHRSGSGLEINRHGSRSTGSSHRSRSPSPLRQTAMIVKVYQSSPDRRTSPPKASKRSGSSHERSISPTKPLSPLSPSVKRLRYPEIQRSVDASRSRERSLERPQFIESSRQSRPKSRSPSALRQKSPPRGSSPPQCRDYSRSPSAGRLNVDRLEKKSLLRISSPRKSPVYSGPAGQIARSRSRSRSVEARPPIIRRSPPSPHSPYRRARSRSQERVLLDDRRSGRQWSRSPRRSRSRSVDRKRRSPDRVQWRRSPSDPPRDLSPRRYAERSSQILPAASSRSRLAESSPERPTGRRSPGLSRYAERRQDFIRSSSRSPDRLSYPKLPDVLQRSRSPVTRPSNGRNAFKDSPGRSYETRSPLHTSPKRRSSSPAPYWSPLRLRSKSIDRMRRSPVRKSPIRRSSPNAARRSPLRSRGLRRSRSGDRARRSPSVEKRVGYVERRRSLSKERTRPRSTERDKAAVRMERRSGSLERTYRVKSRSPVTRRKSMSRSLEKTTSTSRTQIPRQSSDSQFAVSSRQRSPNRCLPPRDQKRISPPDSRKLLIPGRQRSPVSQPTARSRQAPATTSDLRSRLRHGSPTQIAAKDSESLRRGVGCPAERKEGSNSGGERQKKIVESDERRRDRDVGGASHVERDASRHRTSRDRKPTAARPASHQQVDAVSSAPSSSSDLPSRSEVLEARKRKFERPPQIETGSVKISQRESRRSPDSDNEIKNKISKTSDSASKSVSISDKNSARSKDINKAESRDNLQEGFSDISSATSDESDPGSDLENMHSAISENESDDDDLVGLREKRFTERADIAAPPLQVGSSNSASSRLNRNHPPRRAENRPQGPPRNRRSPERSTKRPPEHPKTKFRPRSPVSGFSELSPPDSPQDGGKMILSVVKVADSMRERDSSEGTDTRTAVANVPKSIDQIDVAAKSKLQSTTDDSKPSASEKPSSPVRVVVKKASGTDESVKSRPSVHSRLGARHNTDGVASDLSSTSSLPAKVSGEINTGAKSGRRAKDAAPKLVDLRDRLRGAIDPTDVALDEALDDGLEQSEQPVGGVPWRRRRRSKNNSSTTTGNRAFGRSRYS